MKPSSDAESSSASALATPVAAPTVDAVDQQILEMIRERGMRAGDRLPTEAEIAERFSVSRQKVREGFQNLETLGIVRSRQGSGRVLLDRRHHTLPALLETRIAHSSADLVDAVLVRQVLEVGFLPAAIDVVDEDAIAGMEAAIARMIERAALGEPFPEIDREFHDALFSGLDNHLLAALLKTFWDLFEGVEHQALRHREAAEETIRHHQNILDAVRNKDPEVAQFHMTRHFYDSVESLRDFANNVVWRDQYEGGYSTSR